MDRAHGKTRRAAVARPRRSGVYPRFLGALLLACSGTVSAATLELSDAPLSRVIELYSKNSGKNVFVDETVSTQRKVNAHLQGMSLEDAFWLVQKTMGLESCTVGSGTTVLFPPERSQRYRPGMKPLVLRIPLGLDPKWVTGLMNTLIPSVKASLAPGDDRAVVLFGPEGQVDEAKQLAKSLPGLVRDRVLIPMPEAEAKIAVADLKLEGIDLEAGPGGLVALGRDMKGFREKLDSWRQSMSWGSEVFAAETLEAGKLIKIAEAAKGRAIVADLGGTGAILIEGSKSDRERIRSILEALDRRAKITVREIMLGELDPQAAKDAVKLAGVTIEKADKRRVVLTGKEAEVDQAEALIRKLDCKRHQVAIRFRLAEVSKAKLKTLGIDLDKTVYSYGEIKEFHPKDTLPLLLKAIDEGKDARILAEPNLRVLEGEEAKVVIGDRIPLEVAATAQTDSGSTLKLNTQLQWVDVGIKMTVKEVQVNSAGEIRMGLRGEVSSVVGTTKQGYPQIRTREAESLLRVGNGDSIVMGGLLSREERDNRTRIPLIGKLPLIGGLARGRDRNNAETEIVMIVTAGVVQESGLPQRDGE